MNNEYELKNAKVINLCRQINENQKTPSLRATSVNEPSKSYIRRPVGLPILYKESGSVEYCKGFKFLLIIFDKNK